MGNFIHMIENKSSILSTQEELARAKNYIDSIDFTLVIFKLEKTTILHAEQIYNICKKYKRFLFLAKKYHEKYTLAPTKEIDIFWHNHILDTEKYFVDCQNIFGFYLHHYPYAGLFTKQESTQQRDRFDITEELYLIEFKELLKNEKLSLIQHVIFSCM